MNHIVKVIRMKDQKVRIYELPADIDPIPAGTSLKVNCRGAQEAYGETMTESRYVTDDELFLVKEMLGIKGDLARVRSILTEAPVNWNHVDSHLAQTIDSTGEDADSSTDEAQDAEETEKEVGLDDWRDEAERLVEDFELAVVEVTKQVNFRKGGPTKKAEKEYDKAKAALMKRLTGEGAQDADCTVLTEEQLLDAQNSLTPREEKVLRLRYGLDGGHPHTLEEIATAFNVSCERIRQTEAKALCKLHHISRVTAPADAATLEE